MPKYEVYEARDIEGNTVAGVVAAAGEPLLLSPGDAEWNLVKTFFARNLSWAKAIVAKFYSGPHTDLRPPTGWSIPPQTPYANTGCPHHHLPDSSLFPVWLHESGVERCAGCVLDNDGAV